MAVSIKTNDVAFIIREGDVGELQVWLSERPAGDVVVSLAQDNTAVTLGKRTLRFAPVNWWQPQKVSLLCTRDVDAIDVATAVGLVATGYNVNSSLNILVQTLDTNPAFEFEATEIDVTEGDSSTIGVRLTRAPEKPVTVRLVEVSELVTLSQTELTFDADNFGVYQRVLASTTTDQDLVDNPVGILFIAPDIQSRTVFLFVNEPPIIITSVDRLDMPEETSLQFSARLSRAPTGRLDRGGAELHAVALTRSVASPNFKEISDAVLQSILGQGRSSAMVRPCHA